MSAAESLILQTTSGRSGILETVKADTEVVAACRVSEDYFNIRDGPLAAGPWFPACAAASLMLIALMPNDAITGTMKLPASAFRTNPRRDGSTFSTISWCFSMSPHPEPVS